MPQNKRKPPYMLRTLQVLLLAIAFAELWNIVSYVHYGVFGNAEADIPVSTHIFQPVGNYAFLMSDRQNNLYILDEAGSVIRVDNEGDALRYHLEVFPSSSDLFLGEDGELMLLGTPRSQKAGGDYVYSYSNTGSFLEKRILTPEMSESLYRRTSRYFQQAQINDVAYSIQNWWIISKVVATSFENGTPKLHTVVWSFTKDGLRILCIIMLLIIPTCRRGNQQSPNRRKKKHCNLED